MPIKVWNINVIKATADPQRACTVKALVDPARCACWIQDFPMGQLNSDSMGCPILGRPLYTSPPCGLYFCRIQ